jgi:beta-lactam-binding protein with PASTA domain
MITALRPLIAMVALSLLGLLAPHPSGAAEVVGYELVSSARTGRTTLDYTYRIRVANTGPALSDATARVVSSTASTVIVDADVSLGDIPANTTLLSVDTFTLRQERTSAFTPTVLNWTISGSVTIPIPNVVGITQAAAAMAVVSAGLTIGTVTQQSSATVPAGIVISQSPAGGTNVTAGSAVNIVISTGPAPVNVPNVVGLTHAAAITAISNGGVMLGAVTQQSSATVPLGSVISQSPGGGTSVAAGSSVNIVVSTGPAMASVPGVIGLTQAAATTAITNAGLALGTVAQQSSAAVPAGSVISQSPAGGTSVTAGSTVSIVVSSGLATVSVPNVVGQTQSAATTAITNAGLVVGTVTQQSSATVPAGNVISQNPAAGASVASGSAVNLVVSTGPAPVSVPNVVGQTQSAATTAITNASLVVGTVTQQSSAAVPAGNVISQNPAAGASVANGSAVNLVVSTGPAPVSVPNVVGLSQVAANAAIVNAGLVVGVVTQQSSATIPAGQVINQSPTSGANVPPASSVDLVISSGSGGSGLLSGDPSSPALDSTTNVEPEEASPSSIQDGLVLNEIDVFLNLDATVGQVNAAITSINGRIVSRVLGGSSLTIAVPMQPDGAALLNLARSLNGMPGIRLAIPGAVSEPKARQPALPTNVPAENVDHLLATRSLATLNSRHAIDEGSCNCSGGTCPTVFVADTFNALSEPLDFSLRVPLFPISHPSQTSGTTHGYDVASTLAARLASGQGSNAVIGAAPFTQCVDIRGIQVSGLTHAKTIARIATTLKNYLSAHPGQSVILSASLGFTDTCGGGGSAAVCEAMHQSSPASFFVRVPAAYVRASLALDWRLMMQGVWPKVLTVVAAGNEGDTDLTRTVYEGTGRAIADYFLTEAASATPLSQLATRTDLWAPLSATTLPDLAATILERSVLENLEQQPWSVAHSTNTIIAGALDEFTTFSTIPERESWLEGVDVASFSDRFEAGDPGLFAVGRSVVTSCISGSCDSQNGTSFSTPQVSGLAALLWVVDGRLSATVRPGPRLMDLPAADTIRLLVGTSVVVPRAVSADGGSGRMIDALAAVLSLDRPAPITPSSAPIRFSMMDFDANGRFDHVDIEAFATEYFDAATGKPNVPDSQFETATNLLSEYDLNGDGFVGTFSNTTFDLDPVGSTQRGAPMLSLVPLTLGTKTIKIDEAAVSDLDIICYYAFTPGFYDLTTDTVGGISARELLGCGSIEIVAETQVGTAGPNGQPFASFDKVSINNSGATAFVGSNASNVSAAFKSQSNSSQLTQMTFNGSSTQLYSGTSVNDRNSPYVAIQRRASGSPPTFFISRVSGDALPTHNVPVGQSNSIRNTICSGGLQEGQDCITAEQCPAFPPATGTFECVFKQRSDFDSATSFVDINDNNVVTFPGLVSGSTQTALFAGSSRVNLTRLRIFPVGVSPIIRPQISQTNEIVYRDDAGQVAVQMFPTATLQTISGAHLSAIGQAPGISSDGRFVAFTATNAGQQGVYVVRRGALPLELPIANTLGNPNSAGGRFDSFDVASRYAISSATQANGDTTLTVLFMATRTFLDQSAQQQRTATGLFRVNVTLRAAGTNIVSAPEVILQAGDILTNGKTVSTISVWDPLSDSGTYIGASVGFTDGQRAVVRAR